MNMKRFAHTRKTRALKQTMTKDWLREQNRNFTVGKPPMFSPLERVCRKASRASVWQLKRWAKTWPRRARQMASAHEAFVALNGDKFRSPFIEPILVLLAGAAFIKQEILSRINRVPNQFDFAGYELDTILARK